MFDIGKFKQILIIIIIIIITIIIIVFFLFIFFTWPCFLSVKGRSQFTINENNINYRTYRDLALSRQLQ